MMLLTSDELNLLLAIGVTLLLGIAAISICRFERRCREIQAFWNSPTGTALSEKSNDAETLSAEIATLQQTVNELREAIAHIQQVPDTPQPEKERRLPLGNAVRMAKNGATTDDLTKTCGLNVGEAHLLKKLHSARAPSNARAR